MEDEMERRFRIVDDERNDRVLLCEELGDREVVVMDAASIELAEEAAAWLSQKMQADRGNHQRAQA